MGWSTALARPKKEGYQGTVLCFPMDHSHVLPGVGSTRCDTSLGLAFSGSAVNRRWKQCHDLRVPLRFYSRYAVVTYRWSSADFQVYIYIYTNISIYCIRAVRKDLLRGDFAENMRMLQVPMEISKYLHIHPALKHFRIELPCRRNSDSFENSILDTRETPKGSGCWTDSARCKR